MEHRHGAEMGIFSDAHLQQPEASNVLNDPKDLSEHNDLTDSNSSISHRSKQTDTDIGPSIQQPATRNLI